MSGDEPTEEDERREADAVRARRIVDAAARHINIDSTLAKRAAAALTSPSITVPTGVIAAMQSIGAQGDLQRLMPGYAAIASRHQRMIDSLVLPTVGFAGANSVLSNPALLAAASPLTQSHQKFLAESIGPLSAVVAAQKNLIDTAWAGPLGLAAQASIASSMMGIRSTLLNVPSMSAVMLGPSAAAANLLRVPDFGRTAAAAGLDSALVSVRDVVASSPQLSRHVDEALTRFAKPAAFGRDWDGVRDSVEAIAADLDEDHDLREALAEPVEELVAAGTQTDELLIDFAEVLAWARGVRRTLSRVRAWHLVFGAGVGMTDFAMHGADDGTLPGRLFDACTLGVSVTMFLVGSFAAVGRGDDRDQP